MNKQTIDILLKAAFVVVCAAAGYGVAELVNRHYAEEADKEEVFDQFIDICGRIDGVEGIWW